MNTDYNLANLELITPQKRNFQMLVTSRFLAHYVYNLYEDFSSDLLVAHVRPGSLFIDIGAHYGYYTLLIGTQYPDCKILTFEPVSENYEILDKNIRLNKLNNVTAHKLAASNESGRRPFQITEESDNCGFHGHPVSENVGETTVETVKMDDILADFLQQEVTIKIDTEGHEVEVLEGMRNFLTRRDKVTLLIEFNPACLHHAGHEPRQLLELLSQLDFDVYFISDENRIFYKLNSDEPDCWPACMKDPEQGYVNILCIKKSKSLNVCFFSHSPNLYGAERSLLELTHELIADYGAMVTVVVPGDGLLKSRLEKAGAAVLTLGYTWWCDPVVQEPDAIRKRLSDSFLNIVPGGIQMLKKINPDVIATNSMVIPWGAMTANLLEKPHVWFVREFGELGLKLKFFTSFADVIQIIVDSSNFVFTNSRSVKDILFGRFPDADIAPVYTYFDIPVLSLQDGVTQYYSDSSALKLIIAGPVSEQKGQKDAVLAVNELIQRGQKIELIILGTANQGYKEELERIIEDGKLSQNIRLFDFVENPYQAINQADVILVCSRFEAFGRVTAEAMMLKKPVVGTDSGGTAELIQDGTTGFLYEPGNYVQLAERIEYFIQNRGKIKEFGENGYAFAQKAFTKETFGGEVYRKFIGLKGGHNKLKTDYGRFLDPIILNSIMDLSGTVRERQSQFEQMANEMRLKDTAMEELTDTMLSKDRFISWRTNNILHSIIDKLFPSGSKKHLLATRIALRLSKPGQLFNNVSLGGLKTYFYYLRTAKVETFEAMLDDGEQDYLGKSLKKPKFTIPDPHRLAPLSELGNLIFDASLSPQVSIVVTLGNDWRQTYVCLQSILESAKNIKCEQLVVNAGITSDIQQLLKKARGIRIVDATDRAVQEAKGDYLLFINDDKYIFKECIKMLVTAMDSSDSVAMAGPKVIHPDGKLSSAGGMILKEKDKYLFEDIGCGQNPDKYEFNFVKEVDFPGGSCFIVRKDIFEKNGGFDSQYQHALIRDVDLAFSIRSSGYKVVYQPASVVAQWRDERAPLYSVTDYEKFREKWRSSLDSCPPAESREVFLARDLTHGKKHILFIDYRVPTWDKDAGSLSIFNYIKLFYELGYKVIFLADSHIKSMPYAAYLQQMGIEVIYGPFDFTRWIKNYGTYIDLAFIARSPLPLKYLKPLRKYTRSRILYYNVDLGYLREGRRLEVEKDGAGLQEIKAFKQQEFKIINSVDVTLTPSKAEKEMLLAKLPGKNIDDIPVFIYDDYPADKIHVPFEQRKGLLFLGSYKHAPNVDAILWFVREVFPRVSASIPGVKLIVAGSDPTPEILALKSPDILVTGHLDDLTPQFSAARTFIAPLRYGAGVKGKILTSLSYGLPVVTTEIGNEGLDLKDGTEALIADDAAAFAEAVIKLYRDRELWQNISAEGLKFVKGNFSRTAALNKLSKIIGIGPS
ncbi:MAG: FkbM family methyltransferase [Dehalococcoidia bacterium]